MALAIRRKWLGEDHPDTASSYNNLAVNLNAQAEYAKAQPHFDQSMAIRRKRLGEDHPTPQAPTSTWRRISGPAKYAEAQPLYEHALAIWQMRLSEDHHHTLEGYNKLAVNLLAQARTIEAQDALERAIPAFEASRLTRAAGLERSLDSSANPRRLLAVLQAPRDPQTAWRNAELTLARGLLDQMVGADDQLLSSAERSERDECRAELARLHPQIQSLSGQHARSQEDNQRLEALLTQQRAGLKSLVHTGRPAQRTPGRESPRDPGRHPRRRGPSVLD